KEKACQRDADGQEQAAEKIVSKEAPVRHFGSARDNLRKGADERCKTGQDDRLAAVSFIKSLGGQQVLAAEQQGIVAIEDARTGLRSEPVAHVVAEHCGDKQDG